MELWYNYRNMEIKDLQLKIKESGQQMTNPFKSSSEICLAITEEMGEVAQEVALLEKIGTKVGWEKEPNKDRLAKEISQLLNCIITLANHYEIDLGKEFEK